MLDMSETLNNWYLDEDACSIQKRQDMMSYGKDCIVHHRLEKQKDYLDDPRGLLET